MQYTVLYAVYKSVRPVVVTEIKIKSIDYFVD